MNLLIVLAMFTPRVPSGPAHDQKTCFTVETAYGPIAIPVDEHWKDYSTEERERIRTHVLDMASSKELAAVVREEIDECGYSVRDFSCDLDFETAKKAENGTLIMEGDFGGQIFLTCPMKFIQCSEADLHQLLAELNGLLWDSDQNEGASLHFQRKNPNDYITGGMGGALVTDGLWVHPEIAVKNLTDKIKNVLQGGAKSRKG